MYVAVCGYWHKREPLHHLPVNKRPMKLIGYYQEDKDYNTWVNFNVHKRAVFLDQLFMEHVHEG